MHVYVWLRVYPLTHVCRTLLAVLTKFDPVVYSVLELCVLVDHGLVYGGGYVLRFNQAYILEHITQQLRSLLHSIGYIEPV